MRMANPSAAEKPPVLQVTNLKKRIRGRWIIRGISFHVQPGEVFGFLGPNGAGKTTTIRMLVGLVRPTEGSIAISGIPLAKRRSEALRRVGCIVENPELYPYLSGWENLFHFAGMLPGVGEQRIREVVDIVGLTPRIHDKVGHYSLGMRQRLGIAQALLGNPELLILDEPTNGLDPAGIREMRSFIRYLASQGIGVFVSSHLLGEVQLMCDRIAILHHGRIIAAGRVEELMQAADHQVVWHAVPFDRARELVRNHFPDVCLTDEEILLPELGKLGAARGFATVMKPQTIPRIMDVLQQAGVAVYSVALQQRSLEEAFLRLTEDERHD